MKIQNYNINKIVGLVLILVLSLVSCKKKKNESKSEDKIYSEYFGLTPNRYIIYDVVDIYHDIDAMVKHDTDNYQLKTVIGDVFIDNQGRSAREFYRYKRATSSDSWTFSDLWTTIIDNNKAQLVEENQRIVKMAFPVLLNKTWNPNIYNNFDEMEYKYSSVHTSYNNGLLSFDSTVTVDQESFYSFIDCKRKFERYASGIGLVEKYYKDLRINNFDTLEVEKGNELFYKCIDYGFQ